MILDFRLHLNDKRISQKIYYCFKDCITEMVRTIDDSVRLSKILANSTRREILEVIEQNREISYVDIRRSLGQIDTGRLNYHLKVLGPLVLKDSTTAKNRSYGRSSRSPELGFQTRNGHVHERETGPLRDH